MEYNRVPKDKVSYDDRLIQYEQPQYSREMAPTDTIDIGEIMYNDVQVPKEKGLYGMMAEQSKKQGQAMLDATDVGTYLKHLGMHPETVELLGYAGMLTPMAVGSVDDFFRKLLKKSVKDGKEGLPLGGLKADDIFKPKTPKGKPDVDMNGEIVLKPYKPKADRQLDSARARLYGILLDEDDLDVDLKPYIPKDK